MCFCPFAALSSILGTKGKCFFVLFCFFLMFIYLALPGLSCGTWDLQSSLQHAGFSVEFCKLSYRMWDGMWDLVP